VADSGLNTDFKRDAAMINDSIRASRSAISRNVPVKADIVILSMNTSSTHGFNSAAICHGPEPSRNGVTSFAESSVRCQIMAQRNCPTPFALASREEVDAMAVEAKKEGLLKFGPTFVKPYADYLCIISDPDGHMPENGNVEL